MKVFNNLKKKNSLEMVKYNKKIKERLNLNINDYKEYCETYPSIEIELIPVINKYGKFININEKDKLYYHIYFNNNKKEIKRNHIKKNDKVKKINIIIDFNVESFFQLFKDCVSVESIYFKKFYRNNITNMSEMFFGCSSLKEINLSNFNTNNVTNMSFMFWGCSSLKEINLSNFNINNVSYMRGMFDGCSDDIKNKIREQIKNIKKEAFK